MCGDGTGLCNGRGRLVIWPPIRGVWVGKTGGQISKHRWYRGPVLE